MQGNMGQTYSGDGIVRLFPLPNLVLFPGILQGLHIFEPRYRHMTADALASDCLIAMALLKPGWEQDYGGAPEIHPVVCLGRIVQHEQLPDGGYNLLLRGIARLRILEELTSGQLYRLARTTVVQEVESDRSELPPAKVLQGILTVLKPTLQALGVSLANISTRFSDNATWGEVIDFLSYTLPIPVWKKQVILEEPDVENRVRLLFEEFGPLPEAQVVRISGKYPREFSAN